MRILQARLHHLDTLVPLFDQYRQFYGQASQFTLARSFLTDRLRQFDSVIFLALDPDTSQGLGFTQLFPSFSSVSGQTLWILNDLFVGQSARRRGVARALMESARAHSVSTGSKGLLLSTQINNTVAQKLYEDLGYVRDQAFYSYFLPTP